MSSATTDLSYGRANETVIRFIGGMVALLTITIIITHFVWLAFYLSIDFFLRAFTNIKPPLALLAQFIAGSLKLQPKWIFAPPKKFAAAVGFVFSTTIGLLLAFDLTLAATGVAVVLLICALLESVFSICVGCYVYNCFLAPLLNKLNKD